MTTLRHGLFTCVAIVLSVGAAAAQIPEPRDRVAHALPGNDRIHFSLPPVIPSPAGASTESPKGPSFAKPQRSIKASGAPPPPTIFSVTTTADTGAGSFRRAIEDANASGGSDEIHFQIAGGGQQTITPRSPLPSITDQVLIDASTQNGFSGRPLIQIDGSLAGVSHGLQVDAAGCVIKALSITRFTVSGIALSAPSTRIEGCFIGVEPDGTTPGGNGYDGISVASRDNKIGAPSAGANVISGNGRNGIRIWGDSTAGNRVENSYVGTNASGLAAIPNVLSGILIWNSSQDTIGGQDIFSANVISGNEENGVMITGAMSHDIVVQGNRIGTTSLGNAPLPNVLHGIEVSHEAGLEGTPSHILIGGRLPDEGNLISGNRVAGVAFFCDNVGGVENVVAGNLIGTSGSGKLPVPNTLGVYVNRLDPGTHAPGIRIGGPEPDSGNVVSGNSYSGIYMNGRGANNNTVQGNYIGTTRAGLTAIAPLGNGEAGIRIDSASSNLIGSAGPLKGNIIGANTSIGIVVLGGSANGNKILRNRIGIDASESIDVGNLGGGIYIEGNDTRVGGSGAENVIADNKGPGIWVSRGARNNLRFNSIYGNEGLGIDLDSTGIAVNDSLDLDVGANFLQNFPILDSASLGPSQTVVYGRFEGKPLSQVTVDFYSVDKRNSSRFGEGKTFLGEQTFTTDNSGRHPFSALLNGTVRDDQFITAMATDQDGNSSEFTRDLFFKDSDGDGLYDLWETEGEGIDVNADGRIDVDLYGRGARPDHKDIFVEIHRMRSMDFTQAAENMVIAAFASVPNSLVHNPDLKDGITLHLDFAPADSLPVAEVWSTDPWADFFRAKQSPFGQGLPLERVHPNAKYLLAAKKLAYRYCIFAVAFGTPSPTGLAEFQGNDFMVTLGALHPRGGTDEEQAGTFMHELGHTLGLWHGGGDLLQYKPNYISVMNYAWQYPGATVTDPDVAATWRLDYSRAENPRLIESSLNEKDGLDPVPGSTPGPVIVPFNGPGNIKRTAIMWPGVGVDWNNDGTATSHILQTIDLNYLDSTDVSPSPGDTLNGFNDWANLKYNFRESAQFADPGVIPPSGTPIPSQGPLMREMNTELLQRLRSLPPYGVIASNRIPRFDPPETTAVGGNYGSLRLVLDKPAPSGGITYNLRSTAPGILTLGSPTVFLDQGETERWIGIPTRGVERDTTIFLVVDSLAIPLSASVLVRPASLERFSALEDSGCAVMEQTGFRKKFLAGCKILFEATMDGEAPPAGGSVRISSSRPDLINPIVSISLAGFARKGYIVLNAAPISGGPQQVVLTAVYRGISKSDTVTLMPAPTYTFADISRPGYGSVYDRGINNAGEVLVSGPSSVELLRNGQYIRLDTLRGFRLSTVTGMNDIGWFCGSVWDTTLHYDHPAYWRPDTTIQLPSFDAFHPAGQASAINNRGMVIGAVTFPTPTLDYQNLLWRGDSVSLLGSYPGYRSQSVALNDTGQILGTGYILIYGPDPEIGLRWVEGVPAPLMYLPPYGGKGNMMSLNGVAIAADGTALVTEWSSPYNNGFYIATNTLGLGFLPPSLDTDWDAFDMNDGHEVVGQQVYEDFSSGQRRYSCFLAKDGYIYDLRCVVAFPSGWDEIRAVGINNDGTIVGSGTENNEVRNFILRRSGKTSAGGEQKATLMPTEYRLLQNYPNPFNPQTVISFEVPAVGHPSAAISLRVYDLLGREVAVLVNEAKPPGKYQVTWNATGAASGVYFLRLKAGNVVFTNKMLLLR